MWAPSLFVGLQGLNKSDLSIHELFNNAGNLVDSVSLIQVYAEGAALAAENTVGVGGAGHLDVRTSVEELILMIGVGEVEDELHIHLEVLTSSERSNGDVAKEVFAITGGLNLIIIAVNGNHVSTLSIHNQGRFSRRYTLDVAVTSKNLIGGNELDFLNVELGEAPVIISTPSLAMGLLSMVARALIKGAPYLIEGVAIATVFFRRKVLPLSLAAMGHAG